MPRWIWSVAAIAGCGGAPDVPPACGDPARGPAMHRFAPVAGALDFTYSSTGYEGGGLAIVDLDGDDRPDVVAGRRTGGLAAFANRGGLQFEPIEESGLDAALAVTAIAAADLDGDGHRDLVIATTDLAYVMKNLGGGRFAEAARFAASGSTEHVLPVDLDGDGRLDLYFSNYDRRSARRSADRLYMNRGGLAFAAAGLGDVALGWSATAFDLDADGDQDLYVANDTLLSDAGVPVDPPPEAPWPVDVVLRNDGLGPDGIPRFTDLAPELGLARPRSSMGGTLGDFDDDGRLDLYIPDFGAKKLFVRQPDGSFADRAAELGLTATARHNERCGPGATDDGCLVLTWSAALEDFDLDGYDELLLANGETTPGDVPPVLLFTRGAELPYREVAPGMACVDARALVTSDLDGDGDRDVVIAPTEGALAIYENRGRPASSAWLRVALRGTVSNRDGIGAVVAAHTARGRTMTRAVGAGGVVHAASPADAFFGLGTDRITSIEVLWPSGRRTTVPEPRPGETLVVPED